MKGINTNIETQTHSAEAAQYLAQARQAMQAGDRDRAYRMSLEATRLDPGNTSAWVLRAKTAASDEERLISLSRVQQLNPNQPEAKQELYWMMWSELERDPFLAYLDESDDLYFVRNSQYLSLVVPKDRSVPEPYPQKGNATIARAYRWLALAVLGLMVAGLGTLIFAPLAILTALRAISRPIKRPDLVRAGLIVAISAGLMAIAVYLAWLFWIHLTA